MSLATRIRLRGANVVELKVNPRPVTLNDDVCFLQGHSPTLLAGISFQATARPASTKNDANLLTTKAALRWLTDGGDRRRIGVEAGVLGVVWET
jgi:hypothetical protein